MCLAVPMRVIAVKGVETDFTIPQVGVVEAQGIEKEVRLDLVDRWPQIGDYLIIQVIGRPGPWWIACLLSLARKISAPLPLTMVLPWLNFW